MASENITSEARIAALEAEVGQLRKAETLRRQIRQVDLLVAKAREKEPGLVTTAGKSICLSSACTSVCFSSVSSIKVDLPALAEHDPEIAAVFGTLQQKAIEVLGEEKTVDALIAKAKGKQFVEL